MTPLRRFVASLLAACIAGLGMPLPAQAGMLGTEAALKLPARERIATVLEREDVRQGLTARGVDPAEVAARVAALTDEEAAALAARIDELPAGGVLGFLLLVFVILLLTDILGFTKIFPFTRPVR
jgi:hypothetical protein